MGLTLKYVQKTPAGTFRYRRRVPDDLKAVIGKRELTEFLGDTQKQAATRYAKTHGKFEKILKDALLKSAGAANVPKKELSEFEIWQGLRTRLREMGFDPHWQGVTDPHDPQDEGFLRDITADNLAAQYPVEDETGYPLVEDRQESALINAIRNGIGKPPSPTLGDAQKLYLKERVEGTIDEKKSRLQVERVMGWAVTALGGDVALRNLKRSDAREVRDYLLNEASDGKLQPSSVQRYMNTLRAVINHAIAEFDLNGVTNPFNGLEVKRQGLARDDRHPLPEKVLNSTRKRILEHAAEGSELPLIWRLLEGTGCRLSEITGLHKADILADDEFPHLKIEPRANRRLKTKGSERPVALVGDALEAAKQALSVAPEGSPYVFPKYADNAGDKRGADMASAAIMKHIRTVTDDKKHTIHSLRHNMKDRLISAGASQQDQDAILGHSSGKIGDTYGSVRARLKATSEALLKSLGNS
ncbi:hypothetical protein D8666_13215 [Ochrobactrum soli]|uniref:tyrosine-type recombinase/integrase n=1 Tax=Ochrobactrum soli TaxID=2448455 RepID=UPI000EF1DB10|nr:tyrosine-type recombinase/integrase [[Ochrobactrum] soli]RLL74170.1 hypothetical protein D8666_13215 [[Ochrobactrum] soli]